MSCSSDSLHFHVLFLFFATLSPFSRLLATNYTVLVTKSTSLLLRFLHLPALIGSALASPAECLMRLLCAAFGVFGVAAGDGGKVALTALSAVIILTHGMTISRSSGRHFSKLYAQFCMKGLAAYLYKIKESPTVKIRNRNHQHRSKHYYRTINSII